MTPTYTALVVVLLKPRGALAEQRFRKLQRIRHTYDAAYTRWLPHMTLVPPFIMQPPRDTLGDAPQPHQVPPWLAQALDALSADLRGACSKHTPHTVTLCETHLFPLRKYRNVHLRPDRASGAPLLALQRDVADAAAPHMPTVPRRRERFVPHASLGQAYTPEDRADMVFEAERFLGSTDHTRGGAPGAAAAAPHGLATLVDRVQVMYKLSQQKGPYMTWAELPLAGPTTRACPTATA